MKKQTFINAINALEKQIKYDIEVSKNLALAFPNAFTANLMPENQLLSNALLGVLQEEMGDTTLCKYGQSWIEWFCWETNFGRESFRLKAYDENKKHIPMKNAGQLYNFFIKNKTLKL